MPVIVEIRLCDNRLIRMSTMFDTSLSVRKLHHIPQPASVQGGSALPHGLADSQEVRRALARTPSWFLRFLHSPLGFPDA
jgi:hypothetical protein